MLKAVIVDWGGVLTLAPSAAALERLGALCGLADGELAAAWLRHRDAYDRGDLSAAEYWRLVGLADEALLEEVLAADAAAWGEPNHAVGDWLAELRAAGLRTAVLSNIPREQWLRLGPVYRRWLDGCDEVTLSFELGIVKPDERIFRHCLERVGLAPGEALFVDDRVENVEAARALGMDAVRYATVAELRDELAARYDGALPLPLDRSPIEAGA